MEPNNYNNLVEAEQGLRKRGFDHDFEVKDDILHCITTGEDFTPEQVTIVEHHRFEGDSNPSDTSVIYALDIGDGKHKGILIDAYGAYSSPTLSEFIRKVE